MRIRVLGGGWYGCHLTLALRNEGYNVELHEIADRLFAGASGANPARLHLGPHYPRSKLTRAACQDHQAKFMDRYGVLTRAVPINIYAIAAHDSQIDFGTYRQLLSGEIELITIAQPGEFGLVNVEGAILTGERHIVIDLARAHFATALEDVVRFGMSPGEVDDDRWDWTIDCTFCAHDAANVDRYEPCLTVLLEGPTETAVTVMDGPFPSIYPWNEAKRLSSLTSALYTPFSKDCRAYAQAKELLSRLTAADIAKQSEKMFAQMGSFWPEVRDKYVIAGHMLSIRAMARSGSDARLVDVVRAGKRSLRIRAGKIDAILFAEQLVREAICSR